MEKKMTKRTNGKCLFSLEIGKCWSKLFITHRLTTKCDTIVVK